MSTKPDASVALAKSKLLSRIAAAQRDADSAKKVAKHAKLGVKQAKQKFKQAKKEAKKLRKVVKALKAELASLAVRKPAHRLAKRKPAAKLAAPLAPAVKPGAAEFVAPPAPIPDVLPAQ